MASKHKSKEILSSSDSESDYEDTKPAKKQKKEKKPEKMPKKAEKSSGDGDEEHKYALSGTRFVNVREFKGRVLIDIREYYNTADGELRPGKKGISLNVDQWKKLVDKVDEVNDSISELS